MRRAVACTLIVALAACDRAQRSKPGDVERVAAQRAPDASDVHALAAGGALGTLDHAACRAREDQTLAAYEERIRGLEAELCALARERIERESEWLGYTQALAKLGTAVDLPAASFLAQADEPALATAAPASPAAEGDASRAVHEDASPALDRVARMHEIDLALRSLFAIEQVTGLDLLESGVLGEDAVGPVVLRVLDDAGRPIGSLCADRLRFECSHAARTLTLVLERGYERRAGARFPFAGRGDTAAEDDPRDGDRRVLLPDVDPAPWVEALPELFGDEAKDASLDDGHWDLRVLRATLNQLLREDASAGYYRVQGFAGVQGVAVRDVQLYRLDSDGRLERRLFADRMSFLSEEQGIQILLENGAQVRGDQKSAFLDGHYRIFLPRADKQVWADAGVPGLSVAPDRQQTTATGR